MTDLIKQELLTSAIFTEEGRLSTIIDTVKHMVNKFEPDITTEKGRKELASFAFKIAKTKTAIDGIGKDQVSDAKKAIKEIDNKRKFARDTLDEIKEEVRKPLTDFENAEKERIEQHNNLLNTISEQTDLYGNRWLEFSVDDMEGYLKTLEGLHSYNWQEFASVATDKIQKAYKTIEDSIVKRRKYDQEQKELEELRKQQELEAQKKRDAELIEKAKREERERIAQEQVKNTNKEEVKPFQSNISTSQAKKEVKEFITVNCPLGLLRLTVTEAKQLRDTLTELIGNR